MRKPHERPSIGVLLCASKDNEVVEYALSRTVSPALVAEYQTRLPDRALLQRKLAEFYEGEAAQFAEERQGNDSLASQPAEPHPQEAEGELP